MNKKTVEKVFSIVLFVVAVLMAIFAIWAVYSCADDISQAKASGQLPESGMLYIIVGYYMGNCAQYFAYALLLTAAGLLLLRKQPESNKSDDIICHVPNLAAIDDNADADADDDADDEDDTDEPGEWYSEKSEPEAKQDEEDDEDEKDEEKE